MRHSQLRSFALPVSLAALLVAGGCKSNNQQAAQPPQQQPQQYPQQAPAPAPPPAAAPTQQPAAPAQQSAREPAYTRRAPAAAPERRATVAAAPAPRPAAPQVIPAGTHLVVTLGQSIDTKTSQSGDSFNATVAEPVTVGGVTLIRAGAPASGTVVDSKSPGRFKGQGTLAIRLDTVRAEGRTYEVASSTVERVVKGKGKRTAVLTGGGTGLGALIGGLAGGGKGALIGGLAGAGAGATGSAFTGNKDLVIPAETQLTFRIERDVPLK